MTEKKAKPRPSFSEAQRRKAILAHMRGTARNNQGGLSHQPSAVSLAPVRAPTLAEIEAKYGE